MEKEVKKSSKTSTFILPMVGFVPNWYNKSFINSYIDRKTHHIYLIFTPDQNISNNTNIQKLAELPHCVYIKNTDKYTIVKCEIVNKFKPDFDKFKKGRYSEFSKLYKDLLIQIYGQRDMMSSILFPTDFVRNQIMENLNVTFLAPNNEVFDIIDDNEYFTETLIFKNIDNE